MYFLIDIGASNMRLASSKDLKNLEDIIIIPTPRRFKDGLAQIKKAKQKLFGNQPIAVTAIGIAGMLNYNKTKLISTGGLKDWVGKDLYHALKNIVRTRILIENDAALAGLGEAVFGAGKNHSIVGYLTLSTGVGGTRIVNQKIDANAFGFEPKHQLVKSGSDLVPWGEKIEGRAILKQMGRPPEQIESLNFWRKYEESLVPGINNMIILWSVDILVIGGGVGENEISITNVNKLVQRALSWLPKKPRVVKAKLDSLNVLCGGMALINQQ